MENNDEYGIADYNGEPQMDDRFGISPTGDEAYAGPKYRADKDDEDEDEDDESGDWGDVDPLDDPNAPPSPMDPSAPGSAV